MSRPKKGTISKAEQAVNYANRMNVPDITAANLFKISKSAISNYRKANNPGNFCKLCGHRLKTN